MTEKVLVIVPCLNEEKNVASVVKDVRKNLPRTKVLVINDGSTDKTALFASKAGALVVSHPFNLGYGSALQTGYQYALKEDFSFVCQIDGDGQHQARFLPLLLKVVRSGRCDLVLGSRFLGSGYKMPFGRYLGVLLFRQLVFRLTGLKISDPTSGLQVMNKKVFQFAAQYDYPADFPDADILVVLSQKGFKIKEIGVKMNFKKDSKLHSGFKPVYYIFKMFLSLLMTLIREN